MYAAVYPRVYGGTCSAQTLGAGNGVYPRVYGGTVATTVPDIQQYEVYPRVYGGTSIFRVRGNPWHWREDEKGMAGLSPRVRGNPHLLVGQERIARSIPACTGEPISLLTVWQKGGLSPRVRGNPVSADAHGRRSIPACTGEPFGVIGIPGRWRVYPRVYGGTGTERAVGGNARSIPACTGEPGSDPDILRET